MVLFVEKQGCQCGWKREGSIEVKEVRGGGPPRALSHLFFPFCKTFQWLLTPSSLQGSAW